MPIHPPQQQVQFEISLEKIREVAKRFPHADTALRELFPGAAINLTLGGECYADGKVAISVRVNGNLRYQSFFLDPSFTWTIEKDDNACTLLVPKKK